MRAVPLLCPFSLPENVEMGQALVPLPTASKTTHPRFPLSRTVPEHTEPAVHLPSLLPPWKPTCRGPGGAGGPWLALQGVRFAQRNLDPSVAGRCQE